MHTFKVGDKVRHVRDGEVGIVNNANESWLVGVKWSTGGQCSVAYDDITLVSKEEPMTDRKNHLHKLDKQRTTAQEFEKYYKELRETIETEIAKMANSVDIKIGQVWKHSTDGTFAVILGLDCEECLVKLSSGNTYPLSKIANNQSAYTYLGKMEDVISVVSE